jgi:site-specific DNA-cytosine methylase
MPDSYGVQDWDSTAKTVRAANRIMQAAGSVSDPRLSDRPGRHSCKYRIQDYGESAGTITGVTDVQSGAQLVADPNVNGSPRAGTLGVQDWKQPGKTVIGSADVHAGTAAVADPRLIPADNEQGVWIIRAQDGTRHRPLTTFELAMLQSFPQFLPDGRPFQLVGCNDQKAREYIGNAVPRDAAEQMGNVILLAGAEAEAGIDFALSWDPVWVAPQADDMPALVH